MLGEDEQRNAGLALDVDSAQELVSKSLESLGLVKREDKDEDDKHNKVRDLLSEHLVQAFLQHKTDPVGTGRKSDTGKPTMLI